MTPAEYEALMGRVAELMALDPSPDSDLGIELLKLVAVIQDYEKAPMNQYKALAYDFAMEQLALNPGDAQEWLTNDSGYPELTALAKLLEATARKGEEVAGVPHFLEAAALVRAGVGTDDPSVISWLERDKVVQERAALVQAVDRAQNYLTQMRDLAVELDYHELLHHAGHVEAEMVIVESVIKAKRAP